MQATLKLATGEVIGTAHIVGPGIPDVITTTEPMPHARQVPPFLGRRFFLLQRPYPQDGSVDAVYTEIQPVQVTMTPSRK